MKAKFPRRYLNKITAGDNQRLAKSVPDATVIERLYVNGDLSQKECAEIFEVSQGMFGRWLASLGINAKPKARNGSANGRYRDGTEARPYLKLVVRSKCNRCLATEDLVVHHVDENHLNNELSNLEVLCRCCHSSHHKKLYWERKRSENKEVSEEVSEPGDSG